MTTIFQKILAYIESIEPISSAINPQLRFGRNFLGQWWLIDNKVTLSGTYMEGLWRHTYATAQLNNTKPHRVLMLGFGAGSMAYELLRLARRWPTMPKIVGIEWDPVILTVGTTVYGPTFDQRNVHRPLTAMTIIDSPHLVVHPIDVSNFLKNNAVTYDLIVIDLFESNTPSVLLSNSDFIQQIKNNLEPAGCCIVNVYKSVEQLAPFWRKIFTRFETSRYKTNTIMYLKP